MNVGRNDPCHCGSGKKYKKCCAAKDQAERSAELAAHAGPLLAGGQATNSTGCLREVRRANWLRPPARTAGDHATDAASGTGGMPR
jgi:hypothetical protein